jgi:hypothetical protein
MSAIEKEKIFVELRKYHVNSFDSHLATPAMTEFRRQFQELEDRIVTMLLSLVNGKLIFEDLSPELSSFQEKLKITKNKNHQEDDNRNFFIAKISHLNEILQLARAASFKLKTSRFAKKVK